MTQRNPDVTLTLDVQAVNKLLQYLGKQPFEEVADLIVDIRNQAAMQLNPQGLPPGMAQPGNGQDHHPPAD